jgi:hypothetical protein
MAPLTGWYVNLRANPDELQWQGQTITVGNPTPIPSTTVARLFPPPSRFLLWLDGTDQCVRIELMGTDAGACYEAAPIGVA